MIIAGNTVEVERHGVKSEADFTIKATGKAFKILSDGLYSDKIRAIIRELSCNAYDAHVAAGKKDVPFKIHLPNVLEPQFTVRDFGTGLSHDDVISIFTKYFESTKSNSNDFVGALGLGSKSPFSYVDAYTVVSFYMGKKSTYSVFLGEDEVPKCALMLEEDSTEVNGLEITMPVKKHDFREFVEKAKTVLRRFKVKPEIVGAKDFEYPVDEAIIEGTGWRLLKNNRGYYESRSVAIMGHIAYPLDYRSLENHINSGAITNAFEFDFEIGELEFAASREQLSYKKPTIDAIKRTVDAMIAEMPSVYHKEFENCKTLWEAKSRYGELFGGDMYYIIHQLFPKGLPITWQGKQIRDNDIELEYKDYPGISFTRLSMGYRGISGSRYAATANGSGKYACDAGSVAVWEDDLDKGGMMRIREYFRENHDTNFLVITGPDESRKKAIKALGDPPVRKSSELPKYVRKPSATATSKGMRQVVFSTYSSGIYDDQTVDLTNGFYYVPTYNGACMYKNNSFQHLTSVCRMAKDMSLLEDKPIVLLNTKQMQKYGKAEGAIELLPLVLEKALDHANKNNIASIMAEYTSYQHLNQHSYYTRDLMAKLTKHQDTMVDGGMKDLLIKFSKAKFSVDPFEKCMKIIQMFNISLNENAKDAYDYLTEWRKLMARYPMIAIFERNVSVENDSIKTVIDYINQIDKA